MSRRFLRAKALLLAGAFSAVLALAATPNGFGAGAPRIAVDTATLDFGEMDQGMESNRVVTVRNTGTAPLRILEVISTCACAAALPGAHEIPPGGEMRVQLTFLSATVSGPVSKQVTLRSNDPERPSLDIKVLANVRPMFALNPPGLELGEIERGKNTTRTVTLRETKGRPFTVKGLVCSPPELTAEIQPPVGSTSATYRLQVTLSARRQPGPIFGMLLVQTDRMGVVNPALALTGTVVGPVRVTPSALFLGMIRPDQKFAPGRLTVKNVGPQPVEIKSVTTGDPSLRATVTTVTPGREFVVEITTHQPPAPGWFRRTVLIATSDCDVPLEVPVTGFVTKPGQ
ncbi:MAG: DUF1573 domain-containing protein [Verrucomicrobiae bacterium]|nr:DUF1573 domain-containing protein [Verrucomicrobiae bacterium]